MMCMQNGDYVKLGNFLFAEYFCYLFLITTPTIVCRYVIWHKKSTIIKINPLFWYNYSEITFHLFFVNFHFHFLFLFILTFSFLFLFNKTESGIRAEIPNNENSTTKHGNEVRDGNEENLVNSKLENIEIVNSENTFNKNQKISGFDRKDFIIEKRGNIDNDNSNNHNIEKLNIDVSEENRIGENSNSTNSVSLISPITDFAIILEPEIPVRIQEIVRTQEEINAEVARDNKNMPNSCKIIDIEAPWTDTEELRKYMIENCITSKSWKRRQKCVNLLCNDDALVQKGSLGKILVDICSSIYHQVR